ncbi:MAG TPA: hypothetical protein VFS31_04580, partial [Chitinophagaceae bacterium]|nr:hypothetical protein [Chitinophagaceae bacterium]
MSERGPGFITTEAIIDLHNELVDELNVEKRTLKDLKGVRAMEDIIQDPALNYLQGKVVGMELAVNAIHAFIVMRSADAAGKLNPQS